MLSQTAVKLAYRIKPVTSCTHLVGIHNEASSGFYIGKEQDECGIWRPRHILL